MLASAAVSDPTARLLLRRVATAQSGGRVPSVVAGVVRDGALAWSGGWGEVPGDVVDTQYRIGSITKTLTAVLVLGLVAEGRLRLEDRVGDVIGRDTAYGDRTLAALLAHDGGLPAEPPGPWWERSPGGPFEDLVAADLPPAGVWPSGRRFHYSNLGYALLGEAASHVLAAPWWDCVREGVLEPLGMTRTSYLPQAPAAAGWSVDPYAGVLCPEPATDTGAMAPAGQAWSTVADLARWAGFLLEGHPDVLSAGDLALALGPRSGDAGDGLAYAHGLGFMLLPGGSGTLVGHLGSMPGFLAGCLVDRARGTGGVVLANGTVGVQPTALIGDLLDDLERSEPALPAPWRPSAPVPPEVVDLLGVWHWGNTPLTLTWEGSTLVWRRFGVEQGRFAVVDGVVTGTSGYHAGERLQLGRRPDGRVTHLEVATFVLTRTPYDADAPIPGGPPVAD